MEKSNQQAFEETEKEVLAQLYQIFTDLNTSISILKKGDKSLVKSAICLTFVGADTFSRFQCLLLGDKDLENNNKKRFKSWVNEFVLTERNCVYKDHRDKINCNAFALYEFRNAIIHFYGLPRDPKIIIGATDKQNRTYKIIRAALKRSKEDYKIVNPNYLIQAILEGLLVQLISMREMIVKNPTLYIDGIRRCHLVLQQEGTQYVKDDIWG